MSPDADLNVLAHFLARRDVEAVESVTTDLLVLLGSSLLITSEVAARAFQNGCVKEILVAGGIGHSTPGLYESVRQQRDLDSIEVQGRAEAEILADILVLRHGVPRDRILVENRSTNCGSNAVECKRVLGDLGKAPETLLLIQDPTMQRRTHASFERAWRGEQPPRFISFAPFVPQVIEGRIHPEGQWSFERFVSLLLGEIPRLADAPGGYGPRGADFIEHVDIPPDVAEAHARLIKVASAPSR